MRLFQGRHGGLCWLLTAAMAVLSCRVSATETATEVTVEAGDFALLHCLVSGLSKVEEDTLSWFGQTSPDFPLTVGSRVFTADQRFAIETRQLGHFQEFSLSLSFARENDSGRYRCQFGSPPRRQEILLTVRGVPAEVEHDSGITTALPQLVRLGGSASLRCSSLMAPQAELDLNWERAGGLWTADSRGDRISLAKQISSEGRRTRLTTWLNIRRVRLSDAGEYRCLRSQRVSDRDERRDTATVLLKVRLSRTEYLSLQRTTPVPPFNSELVTTAAPLPERSGWLAGAGRLAGDNNGPAGFGDRVQSDGSASPAGHIVERFGLPQRGQDSGGSGRQQQRRRWPANSAVRRPGAPAAVPALAVALTAWRQIFFKLQG